MPWFLGVRALTREVKAEDAIVVDAALVDGLVQRQRQWTGSTVADPAAITQEWIREEVLFREALRLGLDRGDGVVRRRLVQKMELMLSALSEPDPPSDEELQAYYEKHRVRFQQPPAVRFDHVFFREGRDADALAAREKLVQRDSRLFGGRPGVSVGCIEGAV